MRAVKFHKNVLPPPLWHLASEGRQEGGGMEGEGDFDCDAGAGACDNRGEQRKPGCDGRAEEAVLREHETAPVHRRGVYGVIDTVSVSTHHATTD